MHQTYFLVLGGGLQVRFPIGFSKFFNFTNLMISTVIGITPRKAILISPPKSDFKIILHSKAVRI